MRHQGDALLLVVPSGAIVKRQLTDLCDTHLTLTTIDGSRVFYSEKPQSQLTHLDFDYSDGYAYAKLTPIV